MGNGVIRIIDNEDGFAMGAAILMSAILILAGVLSLWTSNTEVQVVRNEGLMVREFYNAEGGAIDALANYNSGTTNWLTDDFLIDDPEAANNTVVSNDADGQPVATIEARQLLTRRLQVRSLPGVLAGQRLTSTASLGTAHSHLYRPRHGNASAGGRSAARDFKPTVFTAITR